MIKSSNRYANSRSFKDHYQERKLLINRLLVSFGIVLVMLLLLVARSWHLQVTQFEDYQTRSNNNRISVQPLPPKRGLIFDRNGVLLADNRSIYSLEIIPEQVRDLTDTLNRLMVAGIIEDKHRQKFLDDLRGQRRFKSIAIKNGLSEKEVAVFSVDRHQYPGVNIEANLVRHYPFAEQLVHALGYVGRINERELAKLDQTNYRATRHIGKVGLEKYYESLLHGQIGFRRVETDVQGRVIGKPLFEKLPVPGQNIQLSLDVRLQQQAVKAMGDMRGSVVAIDPNNGEVLALVSNPGYNPNDFVTGISSVDYKKISGSAEQPLFNRALRGLYSPGSTIKPQLGWIGLENNLITPKTTIVDPGFWIIPNKEAHKYRDWNPRGHGNKVNLTQAIVESCDPYFYDLAYRMGIDMLSSNMRKFGFGQYTGIDMGEEVPGIMPSREWKKRNRKVDWFPGETVLTGIGQSYWIATPLQLANAIGQLATASTRYQLHLVNGVEAESGWQWVKPMAADLQADFSNQKNVQVVHNAMYQVTQFPRGTAKTAFKDSAYQSAGKTGTVQLVTQTEEDKDKEVAKNLRDNAMYVGYAPYQNPQIAIAVVVENAGHGGSEAAPIARVVLDEYFKNQKRDEKNKASQKANSTDTKTHQQKLGLLEKTVNQLTTKLPEVPSWH